ncbi:histidine kinase [Streptomyces sp. NPDC005438]|uniref:sensor histidine kinase n=1 Tax=Streptomyces sp. NPDC005438 TaxID=3156880 RepID=UPI0033B23186
MVSVGGLRVAVPRGRAADATLAAVVFVPVALGSSRSLLGARRESWTATSLGWVLIVLCCAALYWHRRHPVAVGWFTLVTTFGYYIGSAYDGPLLVAFVIALYSVAERARLVHAMVLGALMVAGTGVGSASGNDDVNAVALFMLGGWMVGVIALGRVRRHHLAYSRVVEQRAITEERLRIARELHDVVGHHLSLINVQSTAALRRLERDRTGRPEGSSGSGSGSAPGSGPDGARAVEALGAVRESSREALRELRATLGMLRNPDERAPTAPPPGLDRVTELLESARRAGLDARVEWLGSRRPLPTEVELAGFRIVQESLTNVARHAQATSARVRVRYEEGAVRIEVTDDGRGPGALGAGGGSGIGGMRERARSLGGELEAGRAPGGGFRVAARLPLDGGRGPEDVRRSRG